MELRELREKYKWAEPIRKVNYLTIPKNFIPSTEQGAREFNAIYECVVLKSPYQLRAITRTNSGGIHKHKSIRIQYDVQILKNSIELTYIGPEGMFRWIFNGRPEGITGGKNKGVQFRDIYPSHLGRIDINGASHGKNQLVLVHGNMFEKSSI